MRLCVVELACEEGEGEGEEGSSGRARSLCGEDVQRRLAPPAAAELGVWPREW